MQEFFQLFNVPMRVECNAVPFTTIPAGSTRFLVIALQRFGHVVMDHEPHIGLVNPHSEGDGRDNDVHVLHQELILNAAPLMGIHPRMVSQRFDAVDLQEFRYFFNLFSAQTIDDPTFSRVLFGMTHNLLHGVLFGTHLIKQILAIERRFEQHRILHFQILLDVRLHLRCCRCGQSNDRNVCDLLHNGPNAAIFWSEIMSPFRNAVGFIDRDKADAYALQEIDVVLFRQTLGGHVQQLRQARGHVFTHLHGIGLG